jgi:hypothetical protein
MIRCELEGCEEMAGVIAECPDIIAGTVTYDLCENCADYLSDELAIITTKPYANKGLKGITND